MRRPEKVFTLGSLFSGIGGLELGLEMTGRFKTVWQVEQSEYCRKVLRRHWPDALQFEDVRNVGKGNLPAVDVICGGFPCQDVSHANTKERRGLDGERSGLWTEFSRIVGDLRPRYVVVENVAALATDGLDRVLASLAGLGYDAEWTVLSACAVGAPHPRERLFVVAHPAGERWAQVVPRQACFGDAAAYGWAPGNDDTRDSASEVISRIERVCGEPALLGGDNGLPRVVDRLRGIGNAVSPLVARVIGEWLLEIDAELTEAA